ncbi:MAG TPA: hypothetical protein VMF63_02115 [Opitutaceae bacterium]|nr:hypothetical protein [Opitutaceae bacterium]
MKPVAGIRWFVALCTVALLVAATILAAEPAEDAVYQYRVAVGRQGSARLWIPPACRQVRGLIFSMENMLERNWLEDPVIRAAAADEGLGIVYLTGRDPAITWDLKPGSAEAMTRMFEDLAQESGYVEIGSAPILWMGHSFHGRTWIFAAAFPERTIAVVPIRTYPLPAALGFTGIPVCYVVGQTTELPQYDDGRPGDRDFFWPVVRDTALALRMADERNLIGVAVDPGGTHTDWSERQARFVALFIRKACQYRLLDGAAGVGSVRLRAITPESGWLTDTGLIEPDQHLPAPYREYRGDPKQAWWFFDEETARAASTFDGDRRRREKQMPTFVQDGHVLPIGARGDVELKFEPEGDGRTFQVVGGFLSRVPPELVGAGAPLGHAPGELRFRKIMGPVEQVSPDTFRVQFDWQSDRTIMLQVEQPGDIRYRRAVQPAVMPIPARLTAGRPQIVTFPRIDNQPAGRESVPLRATADSGLPVEYYVAVGPAIVEGDHLRLTPIPIRSRFPVKVIVVALQWGRTIEPRFQSAPPVEQTFLIER